MSRILAIDYGAKRTGLAVTDPLQIIATGLETVRTFLVIDFLKQYLDKEPVEAFVVGMPTRLDSTDTNNTPLVRGFIKQLQKAFPEMAIYPHDERFTTSMALQSMIASGTKKSDRRQKGALDQVSATIILQSFMSQQKMRANRTEPHF